MDAGRAAGSASDGGAVVTVVVVAWNGSAHLDACLDALEELGRDPDSPRFRTWVIDNASSDDSADIAARHRLAPHVVRLDRNVGFAGAAALGLADATTPYLVVLNQDAVVGAGWLSALLAGFDDGSVAAVTPKVLLAADGRLNNTGVLVAADGYGRDRGLHEPDDGRYDAELDVFGFSGTAAAMRVDAARAVGGFDPVFFLYYEDTDLSWRLRLAGHRVRYAPAAVVRHHHGASSQLGSPTFAFHNERNRLLMLAKCAPMSVAVREVLRFGAITVLLPLRRLRGVSLPDASQFRTSLRLRVLGSFVRLLPGVVRRRRAIGRVARAAGISRRAVYAQLR